MTDASTPTPTAVAGRSEEDVRDSVRAIVLELAPNPDAGDDGGLRLVEDLGFHSLALLELAFTLEDEFDLLPIDEATGRAIQSIRDIQEHVLAELRVRDVAASTAG